MSENSIRFGILGCAEIARKLSRAINLAPNAELYAIGSRSLEKAVKFAANNGFPANAKIYGSYKEVLDDPSVDAVYIPLPTSLHLHWAVEAAKKKKHLLLEKPTALNVAELDLILEACNSNRVQFMDGTMWMHSPRTAKMKELLADPKLFGELKWIHSTSTYRATPEFLEKDIRVQPDLDALGALGDAGWYCIRAILWAVDYQLPKTITALPGPLLNQAGVLISCGSSLLWEDGKVATFHCSFLSSSSMDISVCGTHGSLCVRDFIIPYHETSSSFFFTTGAGLMELERGWTTKPDEIFVESELPQESLMVREFARLVKNIRDSGGFPDLKWPEISRKNQLVLDAVKRSIELDCKPVCL